MKVSFRWASLLVVSLVVAGSLSLPGLAVAESASGDTDTGIADRAGELKRDSFLCAPVAVASFANRVHVKCADPVPDPPDMIYFWVVSAEDQAEAARALSIFLTAQVTGRQLEISFTPGDTSGTAIYCLASNCRLAWGVGIVN